MDQDRWRAHVLAHADRHQYIQQIEELLHAPHLLRPRPDLVVASDNVVRLVVEGHADQVLRVFGSGSVRAND